MVVVLKPLTVSTLNFLTTQLLQPTSLGMFLLVKNQLNDNNGGWNVGASGVTDAGLQGLLGSFTFNNDGAVGSNQTFTLSGLTAGQDYKFTLFSRKWSDDTQRQQDIDFTANGETSSIKISQDHPELEPINAATRDTAYAISHVYTAGDDGP